MLEMTILRGAEDEAHRSRLRHQIEQPPVEERDKPRNVQNRARPARRGMTPEQAAAIAKQAEEWDREVTRGRG